MTALDTNDTVYQIERRAGIKDGHTDGRCYELSYKAMDAGFRAVGVLVHGIVAGRGKLVGRRISHAWVDIIGTELIYDATARPRLISRDIYLELAEIDPRECMRYLMDEARMAILLHERYGPWR